MAKRKKQNWTTHVYYEFDNYWDGCNFNIKCDDKDISVLKKAYPWAGGENWTVYRMEVSIKNGRHVPTAFYDRDDGHKLIKQEVVEW